PIDHRVPPSESVRGGSKAARLRLNRFLNKKLARYNQDRNHPDAQATTGLSPYLHFGQISAHEIVDKLLAHEAWTPDQLGDVNGKNHGFWNTSASAEALLDQLLTWRELSFNRTFREPDRYDRFETLPQWALKTLDKHRADERRELYTLEQFEAAATGDPLWNAAQRELLRDGVMQNYMRMLWGKKILHWSPTPERALHIMIELNNKYALDGRDPNSYSGIFWTLGRFDRAWGPERPIFGSVRYMSSDSARRKLRLDRYLERFGPPP
ncbi:MAG: deoxyribodipyrimidine photolyase, partial [Novipirellula sp. JB048]